MKKAFKFVESLDERFFSILGLPQFKITSDFTEVYFTTFNSITSLDFPSLDFLRVSEADDFRLFPLSEGSLCLVYTFYSDTEN